VELARTLCASGSPINKSQLARALGIARSSLYAQCKRPKADKALAARIEAAHEKDDTMGHRKLAALLGTGKNENLSPLQYAQQNGLEDIPSFALL
jgi:putative transposase